MLQDSQTIVKRNRKVDVAGQPNDSQTEPEKWMLQDSQTIVKRNREVDGAGQPNDSQTEPESGCCRTAKR